jgi:hypothetical protein
MNRIFSFKSASAALIAAVLLTLSAWSMGEKSNEMTIKTDAKDAVSRNKVETVTSFLKGVQDVKFDDKEKTDLIVRFNPDQTSSDMIVYVLKLMGYNAEQEGAIKDVTNADKGEELNPSKTEQDS